jgi:hypothetical protein
MGDGAAAAARTVRGQVGVVKQKSARPAVPDAFPSQVPDPPLMLATPWIHAAYGRCG